MGHSGATLLVGSCEPFSGKSALVMGLVQQLRDKGQSLRYGKPLATSIEQQSGDALIDDDVRFVGGASFDFDAGAYTAADATTEVAADWVQTNMSCRYPFVRKIIRPIQSSKPSSSAYGLLHDVGADLVVGS